MAGAPLDLSPSLKKIERANSKLVHLKSLVNAYVASKPCAVRRERHGDMFYIIGRIEHPVPEEIAFEAVEAILHLCSALDKMMVALVAHNGRGTSGVSFPFGGISDGKPEPFPTARHDGLKKKLLPAQWDLLLAHKPHPTGNRALWAINEIANEDKHREGLVSAAPAAGIESATFQNVVIGDGPGIYAGFGNGKLDHLLRDAECESVLLAYGAQIPHDCIKYQASVAVVFRKIEPVAGKEVVALLNQLIRLTEVVVATFRSLTDSLP